MSRIQHNTLQYGLIPPTLGPSKCFYSAQRLDLTAWCARLCQLLVGFRTHFKSMHFHSFTQCQTAASFRVESSKRLALIHVMPACRSLSVSTGRHSLEWKMTLAIGFCVVTAIRRTGYWSEVLNFVGREAPACIINALLDWQPVV